MSGILKIQGVVPEISVTLPPARRAVENVCLCRVGQAATCCTGQTVLCWSSYLEFTLQVTWEEVRAQCVNKAIYLENQLSKYMCGLKIQQIFLSMKILV